MIAPGWEDWLGMTPGSGSGRVTERKLITGELQDQRKGRHDARPSRMSAVVHHQHAFIAPTGTAQPLVLGELSRAIAFDAQGETSLETFLAQVRGVAELLPDRRYVINLCEDRYRFLVAFSAAAMRGQTTLLPPSRARATVDDVRARHADSYCLMDGGHGDGEHGDRELEHIGFDDSGELAQGHLSDSRLPHDFRLPATLPQAPGPSPLVDDEAVVAIGFTSGSSGTPTPNAKTWRGFRTSTAQNLAVLEGMGDAGSLMHVVATVPPQHMYGMEMSVMLPLLGNAAIHGARPFFPLDVLHALEDAAACRLLVTTPVHLRALVESGVVLPPLAGIITATAPLAQTLALQAESRFGCEVREMFGSTETCVFARRRTAHEDAWTIFPGVRLTPRPDGTLVEAAHLPHAVLLPDLVELDGGTRFLLRGRQSDLLEIAGKRASLADLSRRLLAIPGVDDGVVFQLDTADRNGVRRIAALVVAPTLGESDVLAALRQSIDPVFLPRRLKRVDALPRNATGKLPRVSLLAMLQDGVQSGN